MDFDEATLEPLSTLLPASVVFRRAFRRLLERILPENGSTSGVAAAVDEQVKPNSATGVSSSHGSPGAGSDTKSHDELPPPHRSAELGLPPSAWQRAIDELARAEPLAHRVQSMWAALWMLRQAEAWMGAGLGQLAAAEFANTDGFWGDFGGSHCVCIGDAAPLKSTSGENKTKGGDEYDGGVGAGRAAASGSVAGQHVTAASAGTGKPRASKSALLGPDMPEHVTIMG